MVKKLISISLVAFMAFTFATPLFSSEDCEISCCQKIEASCCIQPEVVDCSMAMTSCETPIALLLISGPKAHNNQNIELTASQLGEAAICDLRNEYLPTSYIQNSSASPPISFLTPLRL